MAIEADAPVFSSEGEAVGTVESVVGDPDADVFTGLAVSIDVLGPARLVPSEHVRGIWPDRRCAHEGANRAPSRVRGDPDRTLAAE
jgi:hypothetical protein